MNGLAHMGQIEDGTASGGFRQFLDGKPIRAGDMLELEVAGHWLPARYEMNYHARQGSIHIQLFAPHSKKEIVFKIDHDAMRFRWPQPDA